MEQKIVISFSDDGTPTIEVEGVAGQGCLKLTEDLERALGVVEDREKKAVFYQQAEVGVRVRTGGGS